MVRSMTGYGKAELTRNNRKITVEMKSVNHRYLELTVKMPKKFNAFEYDVRNTVKKYAVRGKVEMYVNYEDLSMNDENLKFNDKIAAEYIEYAKKMQEQFGLKNDLTVISLMKAPEVLVMSEAESDETELLDLLLNTVNEACKQFVKAREMEGTNLKNDFLLKLDYMKRTVSEIEKRSPDVLAEYRAKLEEKVSELLGSAELDPTRIGAEVTMYADKICVDEEMVRLNSHIDSMRKEFEKGGELGKRLDFLTQEMNREANTILSKANDLKITNLGIDLKTVIEKIREQIQNVE